MFARFKFVIEFFLLCVSFLPVGNWKRRHWCRKYWSWWMHSQFRRWFWRLRRWLWGLWRRWRRWHKWARIERKTRRTSSSQKKGDPGDPESHQRRERKGRRVVFEAASEARSDGASEGPRERCKQFPFQSLCLWNFCGFCYSLPPSKESDSGPKAKDAQHEAASAHRPGLFVHVLPLGPATGERVWHVHQELREEKHQAGLRAVQRR